MSKAYMYSIGYRSKKRKYHGRKTDTADTSMSSSARKLKLDMFALPTSDFTGYRIINISVLFEELQKCLCCNVCHSPVEIMEEKLCGLSSTFSISCKKCIVINKFSTSEKISKQKQLSEVNLRSIYAMRCIGQGLSSLKTFCNIMDLPPPVTQKAYDTSVNKIKRATTKVANKLMCEAATEEVILSNSSDICVSGDGSWKTRGHTSKIGVCTVIGALSGKVIDTEVLCNYCKSCKFNSICPHDCSKNHEGSSGKMESVGMVRIFERSELLRKVRYTKYIGDGDTKTFLEISRSKPYDNIDVVKEECVGHVQKRLGSRLRKLKSDMSGEKLSDGKPLGGKGRLTDNLIKTLGTYYGNAIRNNLNSLQNMRKAVWAVYCHTSSSDEEPMHFFCPTGEDSWCKYQKQIKTNIPYKHKNVIPKAISMVIKKIFTDLSDPKLLKRCLEGKTQNPNESLNSLIWSFCPKTSGSGKTIASIAVNEAVVAFNKGSIGRIDILKELNIYPGKFFIQGSANADKQRIFIAEKRANLMTVEARRAKRRRENKKNQNFLQKEGTSYDPGAF